MRVRSLVVVVALGLLTACAGTSDSHLAGDQTDLTTAPTTEPWAEDVTPQRPPLQNSAEGAESMVRYALESIAHAEATGNLENLMELVEEGCGPCAEQVDSYSAKGREPALPEEVIAGSTQMEGVTARTTTIQIRSGGGRERVWQLGWTGEGWIFEEVTE